MVASYLIWVTSTTKSVHVGNQPYELHEIGVDSPVWMEWVTRLPSTHELTLKLQPSSLLLHSSRRLLWTRVYTWQLCI